MDAAIPGFSGHLVSLSYLNRRLAESPPHSSPGTARALASWCARIHRFGPASPVRAILDGLAEPLLQMLGFDVVRHQTASAACDDGCRVVLAGAAAPPVAETAGSPAVAAGTPVAVLVVPFGSPLDPWWRDAVVHAGALDAGWALVFNGVQVRAIEARRLYSRRYVQVDLAMAASDERAVAALWMIFAAAQLLTAASDQHDTPLHRFVFESDRYSAGVCRSLRDGVLHASTHVLGALAAVHRGSLGERNPRGAQPAPLFDQALTLVYRMLFLLFAEARGLVPTWHPVYRAGYSMEALREAAEHAHGAVGLWDALRAMSRLAHAGCRAGDLRVTPFNGRLFAPARTPAMETRRLDDRAAQHAVLALCTRPAADRTGRERIAYADLGVEQLGAVYETLLDYEPRFAKGKVPVVTLERGSGARKATGTFYTPQPLATFLVRQTLAPLVAAASSDDILSLRLVDPAMGSGAFLVAAARFLTRAYEDALVREGACHPADIGPAERAIMRRRVAERCLYGVDSNPMAVQLARLSLWLATLAGDRPLSFFDHHLRAGDSLVGAWVRDLMRPPVRKRSRAPLPLFDKADVHRALAAAVPVRFFIATEPNDTVEQVRAKERALDSLSHADSSIARWKQIADLWCSHWFAASDGGPASGAAISQAFGPLCDAILTGRSELPAPATARVLSDVERLARAHRFFHWELEFPEVFFDAQGARLPRAGFDAVIGNPPWDMMRADTGSHDDRAAARAQVDAALRFTRDAGIYEAQSPGHANRYQLFVERALGLLRPGGRMGLVLPWGFAADHGSARLRRDVFSRADVDAIVGFDNRAAIFPIHRSTRFMLCTATAGAATRRIDCRLGEHDPSVLDAADREDWFRVHIDVSTLARLSGDGLALPELRTPVDLTILERAAALFPPLGAEHGWGAQFGRELNATDDRDLFVPADGRGCPVIEGKLLEPFRVSLAGARWRVPARDASARLGVRYQHARLGYRDVASATNRTTLIAALLPGGCVSTHTVFCLRTSVPLRAQGTLCALFNSLLVNYLVRMRVTTHVTTAVVEQLPIPLIEHAPAAMRALGALARLLARPAAEAARRQQSARLNAIVASLYQLSDEEFAHVLGTFPLVPQADRDAAFDAFTHM